MGYSNLIGISRSIGKQYALIDWQTVSKWALENGFTELVDEHKPTAKNGMRTIDKKTLKLIEAMGKDPSDFDIGL